MRFYFILRGEGIQWLVSLKKRRGYTETQAERKPQVKMEAETWALCPQVKNARAFAGNPRSWEKEAWNRHFLRAWRGIRPADTWSQRLADRTVKGCVSTVWKPRCVGELLSRHPQEAHHTVQHLLQITEHPPCPHHPNPGKSTQKVGVEMFQRHLGNLKNGHVRPGMLVDEGRQSRDKWTRPRTGAWGRQERFGKRQGCSRWGNHVSKDRHGEMQMSFSNESDVV